LDIEEFKVLLSNQEKVFINVLEAKP